MVGIIPKSGLSDLLLQFRKPDFFVLQVKDAPIAGSSKPLLPAIVLVHPAW